MKELLIVVAAIVSFGLILFAVLLIAGRNQR